MERSEIMKLLPRRKRGEESQESLGDLEKMFDIIVETRRQSGSGYGEFDHLVALAALCKINWPGKISTYARSVELVHGKFKGIARDPSLARQFRYGLSPRLVRATKQSDIRFRSLKDLHAGDLPRKKLHSRKIKPRI